VVALKIIRPELLTDAEAVNRFQREMAVLSRLDHVNVVHAYDAGRLGTTYFLAMEYVEGTDLARLVKQAGPLPVMQACAYIRQAALGLQHAHERGLVHRDIKPHNLIMSLREGRIKVADLGLARLPRAANEEATAALTGAGTDAGVTPPGAVMMGTTDYLAPEQALDFHKADIRADIYSLGCTLWYLLTGQPPFSGGTLAEKLLSHQTREPPAIDKLRPDVPAGLAAVLLTAQKVSHQFVVNVMRENGFDPGPKRGEKTWDEFLKMHAATLWQCDFFSHKVLTLRGVREFFLIAFLHVGSRKVFVTQATEHPTAEWVIAQAKAFGRALPASGLQAKLVFHDRDTKFVRTFDDTLRGYGIEVRRCPIKAPNVCAYVERWIQSIQTECLNHFLVLGEKHLNYLVSTYLGYYLQHRPHQGLDNKPLDGCEPDEDAPPLTRIRCQSWLGGSLKSYSRKAA
jgi:serine/threonine protein kinase